MGDADGNSVTRLGFHATTEKRVALLATGIVFTLASCKSPFAVPQTFD